MFNEKFEKCLITFLLVRLITLKNMYESSTSKYISDPCWYGFFNFMLGDAICNDFLNTEDCSWDGGDCCGGNVSTMFCNDCQCLDPEAA